MFYTYVIKSRDKDYFYKGHCEDLIRRLKEHNSGRTCSNKHYAPFDLVYYEVFEIREEAINREKYFKSAAGRRYLQAKLAQ